MTIENALDAFNRFAPIFAIAIIFIAKNNYVTQEEFSETRDQIITRINTVEKIISRISGESVLDHNKKQQNTDFRVDWLNK